MIFVSDLGKEESLARKCFVLNPVKHVHMPKMLFCLLFTFLNSVDIRKYPYVCLWTFILLWEYRFIMWIWNQRDHSYFTCTCWKPKVFSVCLLHRKKTNSVEILHWVSIHLYKFYTSATSMLSLGLLLIYHIVNENRIRSICFCRLSLIFSRLMI